MPLAEKIKTLRKERGWSQNDLSEAIRIHSKHISRYENGKTVPGPQALKKIAAAFEVSTDYLMRDDVPRDEKVKIKDPELLQQIEVIGQLKEEDRITIKNVIKAMIIKNQMEKVINQ